MKWLKKQDRRLGVSHEKRKYDLPLEKSDGGSFLKILMGLMTILAMFAFVASFALSAMTERWSSGLSNKATIEIPAENMAGTLLSQEEINQTAKDILLSLKNNPDIESISIMEETEIKRLVAPWLGEDIEFDNVPLPGILSVAFKKDAQVDTNILAKRLKDYGEHVRLDTHASWLADVLKFTGALNMAAILISCLIGFTTIIAAGGAVQARMAMYKDELELLHLMGAADKYISRQLQRYTFFACLQGAALGAFIGFVIFYVTSLIFKEREITLLPDFNMTIIHFTILCALPILIALLGMVTARHTVLRSLIKMP